MCKMLISIKPEFVNKIFDGSKKYEFRKSKAKRKISKMIIYETFPVMKVVGEAKIEEIIEGTPNKVWSLTKKQAGIDKERYCEYFSNTNNAVAYKLVNIKQYKKPKKLLTYGISTPPQSFVYMD